MGSTACCPANAPADEGVVSEFASRIHLFAGSDAKPPNKNPKSDSTFVLRDDLRSRLGVRTHGPDEPISKDYHLKKSSLGEGAFGTVRQGTCKRDDKMPLRAIKEVRKKKGNGDRRGMTKDSIASEVQAMDVLDHPHIVRLFEVYQDYYNIYLVMEFCVGGDLCEAVQKARFFSEKSASHVMQQVFSGVSYMHRKCVCHRDLKPDNCLLREKFAKDSQHFETNHLKIIDFGCAWQFEPGEFNDRKVGSTFYIAPEVLAKKYRESCDLWSCGVTVYILLCGYPPFRNEVAVKTKALDFPSKEWDKISDEAKELIKHLICRDVNERWSAEQALDHIWVRQQAPRSKDVHLSGVQDSLREFSSCSAMKKASLSIIARNLSDNQIEGLRKTFLSLDRNNDGTISRAELEQGLQDTNLGNEVAEVIEGLDMNGDGTIEYTEFLAGSLEKKQYSEEGVCWAAFSAFDADSTGSISRKELQQVLQHEDLKAVMGDRSLDELFDKCDTDNSGVIEFEEFLAMMRAEG